MFSFISKFFKKNTTTTLEKSIDTKLTHNLARLANESNGVYFYDFDLYYLDKHLKIEYILYLPHHGIYVANNIDLTLEQLKNSTISKARGSKKSTTNLQSSEAIIKQKLDDILSFNSMKYTRFIYMSNLQENEYNTLDEYFKELLPKDRLIFKDTSYEQFTHKLKKLLDFTHDVISTRVVTAALQSHFILSPKEYEPVELLSAEQIDIISKDLTGQIITLLGNYQSGKSSTIISRVIFELLNDRDKTITIITHTRLAADLLRKELVKILHSASITINIKNIYSITSDDLEHFIKSKQHLQSDTIYCDDTHLLNQTHIDLLKLHKPTKQTIFLATKKTEELISDLSIELKNSYQNSINTEYVHTSKDLVLPILLNKMHSKYFNDKERVMIISKELELLHSYKNGLDEYFGSESQISSDNFSLQYHDFSSIFLTNIENSYGVHTPHVFYISKTKDADIDYITSRATITVTIITYEEN